MTSKYFLIFAIILLGPILSSGGSSGNTNYEPSKVLDHPNRIFSLAESSNQLHLSANNTRFREIGPLFDGNLMEKYNYFEDVKWSQPQMPR